MTVIIYKGMMKIGDYGDSDDVLLLEDEPFAKMIQEDIESYGNYLSVAYFVTNKEQPIEDIQENFILHLMGFGEVEFSPHYSECTGYLWTDENLEVGGHDLLEELSSQLYRWFDKHENLPKSKYLYMRIDYRKIGNRADLFE